MTPAAFARAGGPAVSPVFGGAWMDAAAPRAAPVPTTAPTKRKRAYGDVEGPGGAAGRAEDAAAARGETLRISIPEETPLQEALENMPREALAVSIRRGGKGFETLGCIDKVLTTLAGDIETTCDFIDDEGGDTFPEVREALASADSSDFCVACCSALSVWAVGLGGGPRVRQSSAKVALATALALQEMEGGGFVDLSPFPAFVDFLETVRTTRATRRRRRGGRQRKRAGSEEQAEPQVPAKTEEGAAVDALPRDTPLWISLTSGDMPEQLEDMAPSALVVCLGSRKDTYSHVDEILEMQLGPDGPGSVQYHDDPQWDKFPEVGAELRQIAPHEECMLIAACPARTAWAVGVAMRSKQRYTAAKAALAVVIAMQDRELGEASDLSKYPGFEAFVEEAVAAAEG